MIMNIPVKTGIQSLFRTWTPASAAVTTHSTALPTTDCLSLTAYFISHPPLRCKRRIYRRSCPCFVSVTGPIGGQELSPGFLTPFDQKTDPYPMAPSSSLLPQRCFRISPRGSDSGRVRDGSCASQSRASLRASSRRRESRTKLASRKSASPD